MTAAADYFITTATARAACLDLDDAYWQAWRLLQGGCPCVEIRQVKRLADCWGPPTGDEGLLHRLAPGEHPIAPSGGYGSTATFPPYAWRRLHEAPPPIEHPATPSAPVIEEAVQATLFG